MSTTYRVLSSTRNSTWTFMLVQFHAVGDEEGAYYPHFKGKETEAQTGVATHLRSQLMSNRAKDSSPSLHHSIFSHLIPLHSSIPVHSFNSCIQGDPHLPHTQPSLSNSLLLSTSHMSAFHLAALSSSCPPNKPSHKSLHLSDQPNQSHYSGS